MKRLWLVYDIEDTGERYMFTGWAMLINAYRILKYEKSAKFKKVTLM